MISRAQLKARAKDQLRGRWCLAVGVKLLAVVSFFSFYFIIVGIMEGAGLGDYYWAGMEEDSALYNSMMVIGGIWFIIIGGVLQYGKARFSINFATGKNQATAANLFEGFTVFFKCLGMLLLLSLIWFVGCMLFVIPGFILGLMYSQSFYILAEDNSKSIIQCMVESRKMMVGHKAELFMLHLSFVGWSILATLTYYIGYLWLDPYVEITYANYYLELKSDADIKINNKNSNYFENKNEMTGMESSENQY